MEIVRGDAGQAGIELIYIRGRLDGYWSTHLGQSLAGIIREGARHLRLDFAGVDYVSSAAIGVLMGTYRDLRALDGSLALLNPTKFVQQVLDVTRLTALLTDGGAAPAPAEAEKSTPVEFDFARFEAYELAAGAKLACNFYGDEKKVEDASFGPADARRLPLPPKRFAIGLGALGEAFEDCRTRFGEFLGVPAAVAYQPTDGSGTPDYLQAAGKTAPEIYTLYGLHCDGDFAKFARFEAAPSVAVARFSQLAEGALQLADAPTAGIVMIAETTGLLGVALKKAPTCAGSVFEHPGIRDWVSFRPERIHAGDLALIAGVVSREAEPHLRPIGGGLYGHFHAAAFSYKPLRRGKLDLSDTVKTLFESCQLHGIVHMICDSREIAGLGESEFVRGACWVSGIA
jgi:anti-anti-sigma factor